MQSSSPPVDRRVRPAKTDLIDVEMLLRTLMAGCGANHAFVRWFPFPARPTRSAPGASRTREFDWRPPFAPEQNRWDNGDIGIEGCWALPRDRRAQLADLRQPDAAPLPLAAPARIQRPLNRLELVMTQIKGVEKARDAIVVFNCRLTTGTSGAVMRTYGACSMKPPP